MNRWHLLGGLLGASVGATADAVADCAYFYDYDYAEIRIESVTVGGEPVEDLSAYDGYDVALLAREQSVELVVRDAAGVEITVEPWE